MYKKKLTYTILAISLFLLVYVIGYKCVYGEVYLGFGNGGRHIWNLQELQGVSKDFQFQTDKKFLSVSLDPWFNIDETFQVRTIVIDISEISEKRDSQIFYYSDSQNLDEKFSYYFKLNKGLNYLQIPKGDYNKFRLDLTDTSNILLGINSITTYGNGRVPLRFWAGIFIIWISLMSIIHTWLFQKSKNACDKNLFSGNIVILALCFMLCLYAPLELFFANRDEFWFDVYILLPILFITFLVFAIIGIGILRFLYIIHVKLYQVGIALFFIAYICSYIQGTFLIFNLPPLDGTAIDWNQYRAEQVQSLFLWIAVTAAVLFLIKFVHMEKFYKVVNRVGACISFMLLIALISLCVTNEGYRRKPNLLITNENEYQMSEDTNFIVLLLDALDSRALKVLLDAEPEYKEIFSDFTYYPNTVGGYTFTQHSIPFIFSGDWYENDEPFEEYNKRVYKNSPLFSELERRSYSIGLYETGVPLYDESVTRFDNIRKADGKISSFFSFAKLEMRLAGLKYAPFGLKRYCFFNVKQFNELRELSEYSIFNWSNLIFYNKIQNMDITYTNNKCFKFIHLEGAHVPFRYDKNMDIVENGTYEGNVEACMTLAKAYFEKLKASGVYDNSVIIVMSDHGFDGYKLEDTLARYNPAFLVKGIGEKHDLYVSNAPIAYEDLQEAYVKLLDGRNSMEIFEWKEGDQRERRYLFYYYLEEDHMVEYMIDGDVSDENSLVPTGREFDYVE